MDISNLMVTRKRKDFISRLLGCFLLVAVLVSCSTLDLKDSAPEADGYQAGLDRGWAHLEKRQHSRALGEFSAAGVLRPDQAEPLHGQARALFRMARFDEALAACSKLAGESAEYFNALGFCWGARLEASRAAEVTRKEVRQEIEEILGRPDPSVELLYNAYWGYYYLKDKEKRFSLILRLAEEGVGSSLTGSIAAAIFEEIIEAGSGSSRKEELAKIYVRNFPGERMADRAAAIVLGDLLAKQQGESDHQQLVRAVLKDDETRPLLNVAVAYWLIEQNTDLEQAIRLLQKNLRGLGQRWREVPELSNETLRAQEIEQKRMFYKYLLGRARFGQGETAQAGELFEEVIAAQQDWPGPYHFLGMIALGEGRSELALRFFRDALVRGSPRVETTAELRTLLADHYAFSGEPLAYFQAQHQGPRFSDVTSATGLDGVKASRVAWGDYDNDGDDDLLLDGTRLFVNQGDGGFTPAPEQEILAGIVGANGGVWGDYDNDGFLDIFVTSRRGNLLLHNEGGARFTESAAWPGAEGRAPRTEAAAWGDLNNDGFLDLYVANYEHGVVLRGQCGHDQLFVNRGTGGFEEATAAVGIVSEEGMCGRGVTWSDLNGDGWQDILVANYRLDPNFLWLNRGNGYLADVAEAAGVQGREVEGAYGHSIGSVSGDLDGDGDLDIFTSNLAHPRYIEFSDKSMVLINNGGRLPEFTDRFIEAGLPFEETSADPLLFDVDLDGDLDLYVTSVYRNRSAHLYINDGKGQFSDQTWLAGAGVMNGWGAASADFDGDGYPDLLVASSDGVRLLHNEGGNNNWLAIRVDDQNCNRYGVGSKVTVSYDRQRQVREITAGRGTGSQDSLTIYFGLGRYRGPVSIKVKTLCGDVLQQQTSKLNRILTISNRPSSSTP